MQFIQTDKLRPGMRPARAVYGKKGELLLEQGCKLAEQDIEKIRRLKIFGVLVLEPAEPALPMTEQEQELEGFRAATAASLTEELEQIQRTKREGRLTAIAESIIRKYGYLDRKIEFMQNIRSREDFICKHMLDTAILCTMMSHIMNIKLDEQLATVQAALLHDMGRLTVAERVLELGDSAEETEKLLREAQVGMHPIIEAVLAGGKMVKRICLQSVQALEAMEQGRSLEMKFLTAAKILTVADMYDRMTALNQGGAVMSDVAALKLMRKHPQSFDPAVLDALTRSICFLKPGDSVVLNTGEKALVIQENAEDVLRPSVISLADNSMIDLGDESQYGDIEIEDVLKTMDNRVKIQ